MRTKRLVSLCRAMMIGLLLFTLAVAQQSPATANAASTDPIAHDPTMIKQGTYYYTFITGDAGTRTYLPIRRSTDLIHWTDLGVVFTTPPAWVSQELGFTPPDFWAPDINYFNGKYYLYYAASSFGTNNSVIGLATNTTLDPSSPNYQWVDQGLVFRSFSTNNYNAIDPDVIFDANGVPWLAFGSFWDGIKMRQLDATTGKLSTVDTTLYSLASRGGAAIEGASIVRYGSYYYLFASFDFCCRGVNSDYRVVVGRAATVTGPYVDQNSVPMLNGGGTEVLRGYNEFHGPGGGDTYFDGTTYWYPHHYYDATANGLPRLSVRQITWSNGWPALGDPLSGSIEIGHGTAYFAIYEKHSGLVADDAFCGYEGANIQLWTWLNNSCQQWRPEYRGGGYYSILNRFSNKVFDVAFCGTANGTNIGQWGWLNNNCQKFRFAPTTDGWMTIVNRNSGKVADAAGCGVANGTNIQLWERLSNRCQEFRLEPIGDVKLVNVNSGKALDVAGCGNAAGVNVVQRSERHSSCQEWRFTHTDNGYYTITNQQSGKNMDVAGCQDAGVNIVLRTASATSPCQQWRLEPLNEGALNGYFRLVNRYNQNVVEVADCSTDDNANVQTASWLNNSCQKFKIVLP